MRNETKTGVVVKGKIGLIHAMFSSKIIDTVVVHGNGQGYWELCNGPSGDNLNVEALKTDGDEDDESKHLPVYDACV